MKKFLIAFFLVLTSLTFLGCQLKKELPTGDNVGSFSSYDQLSEYLSQFYQYDNNQYYAFNALTGDDLAVPESATDEKTSGVNFDSETRDHSTTNNQVDGVQESDTIMTDGYYIYILSGEKFFMIDAETLDIIYTYEFLEGYINGMYLHNDKVVLLGSYYYVVQSEEPNYKESEDDLSSDYGYDSMYPYLYYNYHYGSKIVVLDVSNVESITVSRELIFDSTYITDSRMIDGYLYLIMNNYSIQYYYNEESFIPKYMDSVVSDELMQLPAGRIFFMPNDGESFSYLMLVSFDVTNDDPASVKAYLGSTYQIYMSANNLYTIVYKYDYIEETQSYTHKTLIMRFAIEDNELSYKAMGTISGSPLNQFSMDEYEGVFRVAVTDYVYEEYNFTINNTLYLMDATTDDEMTVISKLENLGKPGERIYAVRFTQDTAYVVTFVNTDPLYKLDLSNPEEPVILGEHYEDGVSDYLHVIKDNLMIGVGRQAETSVQGWTNFVGVKVALYDTTGDVPVNLETYLVEGEYSYSRVTYDHKSFMYFTPEDADFTYIAIPVSVYHDNYYRYSQKLYVFKVFHSGDLELAAELQHMDSIDQYFDSIEKSVMIENYIYTMSYSQIQVFDMNDNFKYLDKVIINQSYYRDYAYVEEPISSELID